jgi:hypothetical protein
MHAAQTNSEALLVKFAKIRVYFCERLTPHGDARTPDFRLVARGVPIICEVSELRPNPIDLQAQHNLEHYGISVHYELVGRRLRLKIKEKKGQLTQYRDRDVATMLLFVQSERLAGDYLSEDDFQSAMYGLPRASNPTASSIEGHGKNRLFGPGQCEYISALTRLDWQGADDFRFSVYHNYYATVPIDRSTLAHPSHRQFVKAVDPSQGPWGWTEV